MLNLNMRLSWDFLMSFFLSGHGLLGCFALLVWMVCGWSDVSCWLWIFSTSVLMHNHGNGKVVCMWEDLIEVYKAQVMPGIRPQPNPDKMK